MYKDFITLDELAEYMGIDVGSLPKISNILISRASELIGMAIKNNYDEGNPNHVEAVKLATCSQCQNWIETKSSAVSNGNISSYSLGELSITFSDVDKYSNKLCLMSVKYLNSHHLLYKGMR